MTIENDQSFELGQYSVLLRVILSPSLYEVASQWNTNDKRETKKKKSLREENFGKHWLKLWPEFSLIPFMSSKTISIHNTPRSHYSCLSLLLLLLSFTHPFIHSTNQPTIHPSIYLSIHPFIHSVKRPLCNSPSGFLLCLPLFKLLFSELTRPQSP